MNLNDQITTTPAYGMVEPVTAMTIELVPMDMVSHWRRVSETSCYLARFIAMNFEAVDPAQITLSSLINELIENAVRFTADVHDTFTFSAVDMGETITVATSNLTDEKAAAKLEAWLERLQTSDLEALFVEQVLSAAQGDSSQSGLGFITIAKDHGAKVAVTVTDGPRPGVKKVDVRAIFSTEEVGAR